MHWLLWLGLCALCVLIYDHVQYHFYSRSMQRKRDYPVIGSILDMVKSPATFWHSMFDSRTNKNWAFRLPGFLSWRPWATFCVTVNDPDSVLSIFHKVGKYLRLYLHPSFQDVMGKENMGFMYGEKLKQFRAKVHPLFAASSVGKYVPMQDAIIRQHFAEWKTLVQDQPGLEIRTFVWNLNADIGLTVFAGPYLGTNDQRVEFMEQYGRIFEALLSMPGGPAFFKGCHARKNIVQKLADAARKSRARQQKTGQAQGEEPKCLLDEWMQRIVQGDNDVSDQQVANGLLNFLFASQDASTSSLCWVMYFLDRCSVEARQALVDEQRQVRPRGESLTAEMLAEMPQLKNFVYEILRHRPPVTLVPHKTHAKFVLADKTTVPSGTLLCPSIFTANHEGWEDADTFQPERWNDEKQTTPERKKKNFMTFGYGPHYCLGNVFAVNQMMVFAAILLTNVTFRKRETKTSHDLTYRPTIYPADGIHLDSFHFS
jgi:sterol 22-desaturase